MNSTVQRAAAAAELSCLVGTEQLCCRCRCPLREDKPQCTIITALAHALLLLPEPHMSSGVWWGARWFHVEKPTIWGSRNGSNGKLHGTQPAKSGLWASVCVYLKGYIGSSCSSLCTVMEFMLVFLLQQIGVVCLVILDALLVLGELLMDLKIILPDRYNITPKVKCGEVST